MNNQQNKNNMAVHPASIQMLTAATWEFAHRILWNHFPFGEGEIAISKIFIREYYESIPAEKFQQTAAKHFVGFCERILMTRDYISRRPYRYIPHPVIWLNRFNPTGFAGTKKWYLRLQEKRKMQQRHYCCGCHPEPHYAPCRHSQLEHFHLTA